MTPAAAMCPTSESATDTRLSLRSSPTYSNVLSNDKYLSMEMLSKINFIDTALNTLNSYRLCYVPNIAFEIKCNIAS